MDNRVENSPVSTDNTGNLVPNSTGGTLNTEETVPEIPSEAAREQTPPLWKAFPIRDYIINIVLSIIMLYALNNLLNIYVPWIPSDPSKIFWNILNNVYNHVEIPFLSKAYVQCLWSINIALSASILGNFFLLIYRPRWTQHLVQAVMLGLGILPAYVIYVIYPFKIENAMINTSIRAVLIIAMVGLATGAVINLVLFIREVISQRRARRQSAVLEPPPLPQISEEPERSPDR